MKLQEARIRSGFTQASLAKESGVNLRNIQQYEIGTRRVDGASLETLCKLCLTMGCTLYDVLESEELIAILKQVV